MHDPRDVIPIWLIGAEKIAVDIHASTSPLAEHPEFAVTALDAVPADNAWTAGTWDGTWTPGRAVTAVSPTIGGTAATITVTPGRKLLWARFEPTGGEIIPRPVAVLDVR